MQNAIVITAFRRPKYFSQMLNTLVRAKPVNYKVYVFLEPSDVRFLMESVVQGVLEDENIPFEIIRNPERWGVYQNARQAFDHVFSLGHTKVVYLEEDIVVSPDLFHLCEWYFKELEKEVFRMDNKLLLLNFIYGHVGHRSFRSNPEFPEKIVKTRQFNSLGFAFDKWAWDNVMSREWRMTNWDHNIANSLGYYDLFTLQPLFGRSNHIGRDGGVHCLPDDHDKIYPALEISKIENPLEYQIVEE